ncbi:MAG: STAS domain-containing protein [Pseudonocardiaceae bacterium]
MAEDGLTEEHALATPEQVLGLTVRCPSVGVCVVTMDGELDMLTAPLLEACLHQQFAAAPAHLILDLEALRFLGSNGLTCLLWARELADRSTRTQLHLAGLATRVVARALQVTQLQDRFHTYPTLTHALTAVAG